MRNIRSKLSYSLLLILFATACVDRLQYDIKASGNYGISVDGFISDQPGPYRVNINQLFDIDSKEFPKIPVSVKQIILSDNEGNSEQLMELNPGMYETKPTGMRGQVGNVYNLRIELLDGRIYESVPDTLLPAGSMDSVYYSFAPVVNSNGATEYGFDVFANSSRGNATKNRFSWNVMGTFQSEFHPEYKGDACYFLNGKCNYVPPCSGYRNIGSQANWEIVKVFDCDCCTCWYNIFNEQPILSDDYFFETKTYNGMKMFRVPLSGWIFMHKIRIQVNQLNVSERAFHFWKAVKDQREAIGSLFQPVSGKIPVNFIQLNGAEAPIQGLFYAASVSSKSLYINRSDVPNENLIPITDGLKFGYKSCLEGFPNATNVKPSFWED